MDFGTLADVLVAEANHRAVVAAVDHSYPTENGSGAMLTDEEFWTIVNILSQPRTTQVLGLNGVVLREAA